EQQHVRAERGGDGDEATGLRVRGHGYSRRSQSVRTRTPPRGPTASAEPRRSPVRTVGMSRFVPLSPADLRASGQNRAYKPEAQARGGRNSFPRLRFGLVIRKPARGFVR